MAYSYELLTKNRQQDGFPSCLQHNRVSSPPVGELMFIDIELANVWVEGKNISIPLPIFLAT